MVLRILIYSVLGAITTLGPIGYGVYVVMTKNNHATEKEVSISTTRRSRDKVVEVPIPDPRESKVYASRLTFKAGPKTSNTSDSKNNREGKLM